MLSLCHRYLIDKFQSEDAFIQAFKKVFEKLHTYEERNGKSLRNWISRIMIDEYLMLLRKSHHLEKVSDELHEFISDEEQFLFIS